MPRVAAYGSATHLTEKNSNGYDGLCGKEVKPDIIPHAVEMKKLCNRCKRIVVENSKEAIPDA